MFWQDVSSVARSGDAAVVTLTGLRVERQVQPSRDVLREALAADGFYSDQFKVVLTSGIWRVSEVGTPSSGVPAASRPWVSALRRSAGLPAH